MRNSISFILDGHEIVIDFKTISPTTTVLQYLRSLPDRKGTKEGCAEGDCGACTVVIKKRNSESGEEYQAVDSCLMLLPMLDGCELYTVESIGKSQPHPAQQAMIDHHASQCGFCTPGIVMSLFALYRNQNGETPSREKIDDVLTGNLCRCTGYRPIVDAALAMCKDYVNPSPDLSQSGEQSWKKASLKLTQGDQKYFRPKSITEAFRLKIENPEALLISGATDVALRITKKREILPTVLDLSGIDELKQIEYHEDKVIIGAGVSLNEILKKLGDRFTGLKEALTVFGSSQIRNLGTLGGNLGSASPIGDMLPVLMAYDAKIYLESIHGRRKVDMDVFITGYRKSVITKDEIITAIKIPFHSDAIVKFYKVSKRKDMDISTVSGAFRLEKNGRGEVRFVKLVYGGMAEITKRAQRAEHFLTGKPWNRENIQEAMKLIDDTFTPITDARAGAEFRKLAARNLLLKFWDETK